MTARMVARELGRGVFIGAWTLFGAVYTFNPYVAWEACKVTIDDKTGRFDPLQKEIMRATAAQRAIYGRNTLVEMVRRSCDEATGMIELSPQPLRLASLRSRRPHLRLHRPSRGLPTRTPRGPSRRCDSPLNLTKP